MTIKKILAALLSVLPGKASDATSLEAQVYAARARFSNRQQAETARLQAKVGAVQGKAVSQIEAIKEAISALQWQLTQLQSAVDVVPDSHLHETIRMRAALAKVLSTSA